MNRKTSRMIFLLLLFLLVLIYYFRKRGEERIITGVEDTSGKKASEQTVADKTPISQASSIPTQPGNIPSPEKTPDPFEDLEPSTPVLAMLYGKVTDKQGNPLPETRVIVRSNYSFYQAPEDLASAFTDKKGEYSLKSLPVSTVQILAMKQGYYLEHASVTFIPTELMREQNFEITKGGLSLAGRVKDQEGNAVSAAKLQLYLPGSNLFLIETTDNQGAFGFEGLLNTPGALSVLAPEFVAWFSSPVTPGKEDMEIILSRDEGTRIRGRAVSEISLNSEPDAWVICAPINRQRNIRESSLPPFFSTRANDKSVYDLGLFPSGIYKLSAFKDERNGNIRMEKEIELVSEGPAEIRLDLFIPGSYDVRGCVLDADDNRPIPGALVRVPGYETGSSSFYIRFPGSQTVRTDQQGRFRIPRCVDSHSTGNMCIIVEAPPYYSPSRRNIKDVSKHIPPVTIKLDKGISVQGNIYSSSGEPVSQALVQIYHKGSSLKSSQILTDNKGRFQLVLESQWLGGKANIYAYSSNHGFTIDTISIPDSTKEIISHDLNLSPGIPLTVVVKNQKGQGIKDCLISVNTWKEREFGFFTQQYTSIEGRAFFDNLPHYKFRIDTSKSNTRMEGSKQLDLTNAEGPQDILFTVDEKEYNLIMIYGTVIDEQKLPLKDVRVYRAFSTQEVHTDTEGKYRIEFLSTPDCGIMFSKPGYSTLEKYYNRREKEFRVDTVLKKGDLMFGTMRALTGESPTEAEFQVFMRERGDTIVPIDFRRMSLKQGGTFEIELIPGHYDLNASYFISAKHQSLGAGHSQEINAEGRHSLGPFEITLSRGMLKGFIRDAKTGDPVTNAIISAYPFQNYQFQNKDSQTLYTKTQSDENGYYELFPLDLGSRDIYFYHPEYWVQKQVSPEIKGDNLEQEWNPILTPLPSLEGRVLNNEGAPLRGVIIFISPLYVSDNKWTYNNGLLTDDEGHYVFKGIPQGKYRLNHGINPNEFEEPYSCHISYIIDLTKPDNCIMDFQVPELVPVFFEKMKGKSLFLAPVYPAEFNHIEVRFETDKKDIPQTAVYFPPGRYALKTGDEFLSRNIEIKPKGENRIIVVEYESLQKIINKIAEKIF